MPFDTPLSPPDEAAFQQWFAQNKQAGTIHPLDTGQDYDLRGAFKAGVTPGADAHWPDTFKKPNHPTFSDESIYSSLTGTRPGSWEGHNYVPFGYEPPAPQPTPFIKTPLGNALETGLTPLFKGLDLWKEGMDAVAGKLRQLDPTSNDMSRKKRLDPNTPSGLGFEPHPLWKALEGVIKGLRAPEQTSQAPWGMHEPTLTASQAVGPAMTGALDVMSDPRNAWMGLGPIAGVMKFGGGVRGGMKGMKDMGGFSVPTGDMRQALEIPRPNLRMGESMSGADAGVRQNYLDTMGSLRSMANAMMDPSHPYHEQVSELYATMPGHAKQQVYNTMQGMGQFNQYRRMLPDASNGGAEPPNWFTPRQ